MKVGAVAAVSNEELMVGQILGIHVFVVNVSPQDEILDDMSMSMSMSMSVSRHVFVVRQLLRMRCLMSTFLNKRLPSSGFLLSFKGWVRHPKVPERR